MQAEAIEAEALRRSDELKTALLRSVSHDLRTPLTSIIAAGAALDSPTLTAEERARAERGGGRGRASGSRAWSRTCSTSRGWSPARPSRGGSRSTWRGCWRRRGSRSAPTPRRCRLGDRPRAAGARSPTRPSSSAPSPTSSRTRSATAAARPVLVRSRQVGGGWSVRVVDQGPGIPEREWERIFEPFYRRDGSGERLRPRPGDRQGLRRGQRRRDRGRVAAGPGQQLRRLASRWREEAGVSERAADPRLRRRAADPPGAAGDPPRRRLRGGAGEQRRGGARPGRGAAARRRRSST